MALVNTPTAKLDFTYVDGTGSRGHTLVHVPYATLAAAAIVAADLIAAAMVALSDAVILGYSLTYTKFETAPGTPDAASRVEEKGFFSWRTANARTSSFTIPAIKDSLLTPSGKVDPADALVIALVDVVSGTGTIFAGADGSDITGLLRAYQRFNRSTRQQLPGDR
jgi:hypothetical protein